MLFRLLRLLKLSERAQYRFLEMLPGFLVWVTFAVALLLSFAKPLWAIYFIIVFDLFWLTRIGYVLTFTVLAYRRFHANRRTDWLTRCESETHRDRFNALFHLVVIPTYNDELHVLTSTFAALTRVRYPLDRFIVVLATEERDHPRVDAVAAAIEQEYGHRFFRFLVTTHPAGLPGELAGKGSNTAWAGKSAQTLIDDLRIPYERVLVSSFDVDTCVDPQYFACLTYAFLTHPKPLQTSFQPIPLFHNNIWDAPALMRVVANSTTFWLLSESMRPDRMFTFSSHSMSFKTLVDVGFWQSDIVTEDSRIFIQGLLHFDGDYIVTPIDVPVSMDTVVGKSWWESLRNQYKQIRRWAYGVENFPYMAWNFAVNPKIPFRVKFRYLFNQLEGTYSWATAPILIFLIGRLAMTAADAKTRSLALYSNAPATLQVIMVIAMVGLIATAIMNTLMLPRPITRSFRAARYVAMVLQWILIPVTMVVFGSLPAIDAQTRLMLGKYLGFQVTEKVRRLSPGKTPPTPARLAPASPAKRGESRAKQVGGNDKKQPMGV